MKVYMVTVTWDCHGEVYCAVCDDIPLCLECPSFDGLIDRVQAAGTELIEINKLPPVGIFHFLAERRVGVM